ncbi:dihydroxyacetone kinase subunit DhaK [Nanchangia anserum]|uniref:Dihydroxyacetone kinase subunit DhaK n=1 Tax=Nanchangia anserum TaxID=2692125 RepID=A0A8I0KNM8_9ACTO|nr:dihydroxyacetone kinase subunit DhaK [Nanchangia anserum]MBD3689451.1 dihydroxyacetone kinase subunit DhaK [Nanchangia anserum]
MKKILNSADTVVTEFLTGFAAAHPDTHRVDLDHHLILRADAGQIDKVGIVSGGGSGHEPLHGGYVGPGMLDAACCGEVFTSPVPDQILAATEAVDAGKGVLHIVKNYTGDVMNFEMAAEMIEGTRVETVVVADDVAVQDSLYTTGRRGVGGTVFVEKIAGAVAEKGASLDEVTAVATDVSARVRSFGVALTSCTVPAAGKPTFDLDEGHMELGIGIHGEPGRERVPIASAHDLAAQLARPILDDADFTSDPVIVMVNGMGATPLLELYLLYGEVARYLEDHGVTIARCKVGNYITSLDMAGASLTMAPVTDELLAAWDAPSPVFH